MEYAVKVVEKAEAYYNRDMPSADRNAKKNPYQVSARYGFL